VEAIKLFEEARDMFVQVYLIVVVLNIVIAAIALLLLSCCYTPNVHQGVLQASSATSDSVICASCAGVERGEGAEDANVFALHPVTAVAPMIKGSLSPHPPPPIFLVGTWRGDPSGRGRVLQ